MPFCPVEPGFYKACQMKAGVDFAFGGAGRWLLRRETHFPGGVFAESHPAHLLVEPGGSRSPSGSTFLELQDTTGANSRCLGAFLCGLVSTRSGLA